jgi:hypothetical protein
MELNIYLMIYLPPLPIVDFRASFTWMRIASLIAGGICIIIGFVHPQKIKMKNDV